MPEFISGPIQREIEESMKDVATFTKEDFNKVMDELNAIKVRVNETGEIAVLPNQGPDRGKVQFTERAAFNAAVREIKGQAINDFAQLGCISITVTRKDS